MSTATGVQMAARYRNFGAPVLGICGYSGSGKTTVLEAAIPQLIGRGLAVAVVKHDAHGFTMDQPGKDSDRVFRVGATVVLRGPSEQAQRRGASAFVPLESTLADLARDHDLILVEGHKGTDVPKLWVSDEKSSLPPSTVKEVLRVLPWNSERLEVLLNFIDDWLPRTWNARTLCAGMLVGGKNSPLTAKAGLTKGLDNRAGFEFAILGSGSVPATMQNENRLPDVPEVEGPLAGLLAAHRWNPRAAWLVSDDDHPRLSPPDVQSLVEQRKPGTWSIMVTQQGEPRVLGLFEPQSLEVLERAVLERGPESVRIGDLREHPRTVIIPA
jgi:molybdopterin-guanine dinucleotide biosynthesis protein MobB